MQALAYEVLTRQDGVMALATNANPVFKDAVLRIQGRDLRVLGPTQSACLRDLSDAVLAQAAREGLLLIEFGMAGPVAEHWIGD